MANSRAKLWLEALAAMLARRVNDERFASRLHARALAQPAVGGVAGVSAAPRDFRPTHPERGRAILAGEFVLAGLTLTLPPGGEPWNRPSPSQAFAVELHRMDWLHDLVAAGDTGVAEALRLVLEWLRLFSGWNAFSWRGDILERRVFNLACHARALAEPASEWEGAHLAETLAAQARHLLLLGDAAPQAADRLAAAAVAGASLLGEAGEALMERALPRLEAVLKRAVLADGVHTSRSPQAGLELLLALTTLDDAIARLGRPADETVSRAIDRLSAGLRFFTLPDGRLPAFHGGALAEPGRVADYLPQETQARPGNAIVEAPYGGYQRLDSPKLTVMIDAAAPAIGAWSLAACGQPAAIQVVAGHHPLIEASAWSAEVDQPQALRLAGGGSTASLGVGSAGASLHGPLAVALGPRLSGGATKVQARRHQSEAGIWVEVSHDGWVPAAGLTHERRLYLDRAHDELRGEDRFLPGAETQPRPLGVAIHFLLHPEVRALVSRDQNSVLLRGRAALGWWLRHDAGEATLEPAVLVRGGAVLHTQQIILRGRLRADRGGRVRWKLAAASETH